MSRTSQLFSKCFKFSETAFHRYDAAPVASSITLEFVFHFSLLLTSARRVRASAFARPFDDEPSRRNRHSSSWSGLFLVIPLAVPLLSHRHRHRLVPPNISCVLSLARDRGLRPQGPFSNSLVRSFRPGSPQGASRDLQFWHPSRYLTTPNHFFLYATINVSKLTDSPLELSTHTLAGPS